ncbi:hypothetical protein A2858_00030 [Candidatus Daviesbacteria bacterium RIFCSPHIGHO2_01_FULL_36_37]|uniref:T4-like protein proximal tail fiber n=3 Tax=Candidatus Daviesiibacteriota TaxID=1752718 RepID=A0A0G0EJP0_9BACT|nr:MAG: hypothetical protein US19_C0051G0010 [Candidatus Daviesbacteria bacterium GW2011_GWB1_36_5]OGE17006.1 MAG: hypothetical protein A2858_00030 [Candidatus Daviesbacteria bacterium RIFCSPHIGHO2_01_FULL_36_37]OGE32556.1 MAG: hypothetical protein A3C99_00235 [Candidatus Daviesbacteria bacterium RIFCSPHIGHO2_02_FULL_37_9]OGE35675.1 MAG: hypothetical protein A3E66_04395 [Candidatus Daviesbacteria bacterium RIFCSPHIGHO2_12_FULL_37_16]
MRAHISLIAYILFLLPLVAPTQALAVVQSLNGQTGNTQTFQNDSNVAISSSGNVHSLGWLGLLPLSRGGTGANSFTTGSVLFSNGTSISQNNSNLFWNNANNRLGIGTNSPAATLDVSGNARVSSLTSSGDATINTLNVGLGGGAVSTNTAVGTGTLLNANASSSSNTAVGYRALTSVGGSLDSTAVGYYALISSTGSDSNTAVGSSSMRENTIGRYNSAVGTNTLRNNNTGEYNTALGFDALFYNYDGGTNIGIGYRAGIFQADESTPLTSPENSIYIGNYTKGYDNNDSNSIVIGSTATGAGPNTAVIGNSSMTDAYFGSSSANADTHARKVHSGSSSVPGCIVMGDTAGGIGYITLTSGVLTVSSTPPSACQ